MQATLRPIAIFVFLILLFSPWNTALSQTGGEIHDPCGSAVGECNSGLVCEGGQCLGWVGYITDDVGDCAPRLVVRNGRCEVDIGEGEVVEIGVGDGGSDLRDQIRRIINIALGFLGIAGVLVVMYGGFLLLTATGREERVEKGKLTILWGAAGLAVIALSWTIASFIIYFFSDKPSGPPPLNGGEELGGSAITTQFEITDVLSKRDTSLSSNINEQLYKCTAITTVLNSLVDEVSFDTATSTFRLQLAKDNGGADPETWAPVVWPASVNNGQFEFQLGGQSIVYQHFVPSPIPIGKTRDDYLFTANSTYALLFPKELEDISDRKLSACSAAQGCQSTGTSDQFAWVFNVGAQDDIDSPHIASAYPYYDKVAYDAGALPSLSTTVGEQPQFSITFSEAILQSSLLVNGSTTPLTTSFIIQKINQQDPTDEMKKDPATKTTAAYTVPTGNGYFLGDLSQGGTTFTVSALIPGFFENNTWYRITLKDAMDLCGNQILSTTWLFEVNGLTPSLSGTPINGLDNVCVNIEVGAVSTVPLYDPAVESCDVGVGYVSKNEYPDYSYLAYTDPTYTFPDFTGAAWTADTRTLQKDDPNCRVFNFLPETDSLEYNKWYKAVIKTRYPLPSSGTLQAEWYFRTADKGEECVNPPIIYNISPFSGPKGQCITIQGKYLTNAYTTFMSDQPASPYGSYITVKGKDAAASKDPSVPPNEPVPNPPNNETKRFSSSDILSWTDSTVIASIPQGLNDFPQFNNVPEDQAEHPVEVMLKPPLNTGTYLHSRPYPFRLDLGSANGPCLSLVEPSPFYRGEEKNLHGVRFLSAADTTKQKVWFEAGLLPSPPHNYSIDILDAKWQDALIKATLPFQKLSGDSLVLVQVENDNGMSNPYPITLPVLQDVAVWNRTACNPYISVNPRPTQTDVCMLQDAEGDYFPVLVEFDYNVVGGDSEFKNTAHYKVYKCNNASQAPLSCADGYTLLVEGTDYKAEDISMYFYTVGDDAKPHSHITFKLRGVEIIANQTYKMIVDPIMDDKGIATPADFQGFPTAGTWEFRTTTPTPACTKIASVTVTAGDSELRYPEDTISRAQAMNAQCQELPGKTFTWSAAPMGIVALAPYTDTAFATVSSEQFPELAKRATVEAKETTTAIAGTVTIDVLNSAACRSTGDCTINGCLGSVCDMSTTAVNPPAAPPVGRCTPFIRAISPDKANVAEWITLQGCYFGGSRGSDAEVLFEESGVTATGDFTAFPAQCPKLWQDTQIIVAVPGNLSSGDEELIDAVNVKTDTALYSGLLSQDFTGFTAGKLFVPRPMVCAIEPDNGGVGVSVTLHGKNFNTDGTLDNEKFVFSPNSDLSNPKQIIDVMNPSPVIAPDPLPPAPPVNNPGSLSVDSVVPIKVEAGKNYVAALEQSAFISLSNTVEFTVTITPAPEVVSYAPKENTYPTCTDDPSRPYCQLPENSGQVIMIDLDKGLDASTVCDDAVFDIFTKTSKSAVYGSDIYNAASDCLYDSTTHTWSIDPQGANLKVGKYIYKVVLDPSKVYDSQGKPLECGVAPEKGGKCEWEFVVTNRVDHIRVYPMPNPPAPDPNTANGAEDGIIYTADFLNIKQDSQEYFIAQAFSVDSAVITYNFGVGEVFDTLWVPSITNDGIKESSETILFQLNNPTGGLKIQPQGYVLIIDDDDRSSYGVIRLSDIEYPVTEGPAGTNAVVYIIREGGSYGTVTIQFASVDKTALAPGDYTSVAGTATFSDGEVVYPISIPIIDDAVIDVDSSLTREQFLMTLNNPGGGATLNAQSATSVVSIYDNDDSALTGTVLIISKAVKESVGSPGVTIARTGSTSGGGDVDLTILTSGSATPGIDYAIDGITEITNFIIQGWTWNNTELNKIDAFGPGSVIRGFGGAAGFLGASEVSLTSGTIPVFPYIASVIDPRSLIINSHNPGASTNICRNTAIDLTFNHSIDSKTVLGANNIKLYTSDGMCLAKGESRNWFTRLARGVMEFVYTMLGRAIAASGGACSDSDYTLSVNGAKVILTPSNLLKENKDYTVVVKADNPATVDMIEGVAWNFGSKSIGLDASSCGPGLSFGTVGSTFSGTADAGSTNNVLVDAPLPGGQTGKMLYILNAANTNKGKARMITASIVTQVLVDPPFPEPIAVGSTYAIGGEPTCEYTFTTRLGYKGTTDANAASLDEILDSSLQAVPAYGGLKTRIIDAPSSSSSNEGVERTIQSSSAGKITTTFNFPVAVETGTTFTINNEGICVLDLVTITHDQGTAGTPLTLYNDTATKTMTAQGYSESFSNPIMPLAGVYDWNFKSWRIDPSSYIIKIGQVGTVNATTNPTPIADGATPPQGEVLPQHLDVNGNPDNATGKIKSGDAQVRVTANIVTDIPQGTKNINHVPLTVEVRPCNLPQGAGDSRQFLWEFKDMEFRDNTGAPIDNPNIPGNPADEDPYVNFYFSYCKEYQEETQQFLPNLLSQAIPLTQKTPRVLKEYFLKYDPLQTSLKDVFLMRVFGAEDYVVGDSNKTALEKWYEDNEASLFKDVIDPKKEPLAFSLRSSIDGYTAGDTKQGGETRALYIHALNVGKNNTGNDVIYSNIYALAVNDDAATTTQNIFKQLGDNWRFNQNIQITTNPSPGTPDIASIDQLKDDFKRIQDAAGVAYEAKEYRNSNLSYPALPDARATGTAVSVWGNEWRIGTGDERNSLTAAFEIPTLPIDPDDVIRDLDVIRDTIDEACMSPASVNMYQCFWGIEGIPGIPGNAPMRCLAGADGITTEAGFQALGLGYGVTTDGVFNSNEIDPDEIVSCWDNEFQNPNATLGKYYCKGDGSPVYQYSTTDQGKTFTVYMNLEYNRDTWCRGWINTASCAYTDKTSCSDNDKCYWDSGGVGSCKKKDLCGAWAGANAKFCKLDNQNDPSQNCKPIPVTQPACAGGKSPYNTMFISL